MFQSYQSKQINSDGADSVWGAYATPCVSIVSIQTDQFRPGREETTSNSAA